MNHKILLLNGPNLNLLGLREPNTYGTITLKSITARLEDIAKKAGIFLECFQSNFEGELIEKTAEAFTEHCDFILVNPAGLTHTSIAWRDTLAAINVPFIELHLSNIYAREEFRKNSFFSDIALGVISGLGDLGYDLALSYAINFINNKGTI